MKKLLDKINPCAEHHAEDSWVWRLMSYLFPDCWCCAGVRGFLYGVLVMGLLSFLWW